MLITKFITVKWTYRSRKWYESKGYTFTNINDEFLITPEELTRGNGAKVEVMCDNEDCKNRNVKLVVWKDYVNIIEKNNGKYFCQKCAIATVAKEKIKITKFKNSQSFEDWCIENNRQDILERWDYDLNDCKPSEVCYGTHKEYYFKCPKGVHKSELNNLKSFIGGLNKNMDCKSCSSFGQYLIDTYGSDALEKYWSKNNTINPWKISYGTSKKKVIINCQECNNNYNVAPNNFYYGSRCPICNESKGEVKIRQYLQNQNIKNEDQKEFEGLIGLGGGNLSYDFYLPQYNLLIEYQGEFHNGKVGKNAQTKEDLEYQQEHDRRKREYAKQNNINLLEIWYWDFDNIEKILDKELNISTLIKQVG